MTLDRLVRYPLGSTTVCPVTESILSRLMPRTVPRASASPDRRTDVAPPGAVVAVPSAASITCALPDKLAVPAVASALILLRSASSVSVSGVNTSSLRFCLYFRL